MINSTTAAINRSKISDNHTLNVSDYDPAGFESLETWVSALAPTLARC